MSQWFRAAAELVLARNSTNLLTIFTKKVREELGLDRVYLLQVSEDGRFLEYTRDEQKFAWPVADFNHPFSHVIQSNTTMVLRNSEIFYWLTDNAFNQLVSPISEADKIVILPMKAVGKTLQSILMLQGNTTSLEQIADDDDFSRVLAICSNHLQLLYEIENRKKKSNQLFQSLTEVETNYHKYHQAGELSSVLIGSSDVMKKLREQVVSAASSHLSVMVQGETGTGKELVSKAVHDLSTRNEKAFVAINCAAIPEHLLESELFGYVKGAFSGADKDKKGLLGEADGGTLFLDEIGDMPIGLQAKLLRVLETKAYRPVGGKKELSSDFRLVVATHVNLKEKVTSNDFRKDLYYRIYQYPITLPSLASRKSDIEQLSQYFIGQYNQEQQANVRGLHYLTLDRLLAYPFPGNVRELKHLIEYGCAQAGNGAQIEDHHIVSRLDTDVVETESAPIQAAKLPQVEYVKDLKTAIKNYEAKIIASRLKEFSGDRLKAAESLGIPKRTLADKCLKLEIAVNE